MSDHDPLCPVSADPSRRDHCGVCVLIARVRAHERHEAQLDLEAGIVYRDLIRDDVLADLRVKLDTIPSWEDREGWLVLSYKDVRALLDGGGDD